MKKHLCLLLATALLLGGLAGCGPIRPSPSGASSNGASSSGASASSGTSESDDGTSSTGEKPPSFQIGEDQFVTPCPSDVPGDQLDDDAIIKMCAHLFQDCSQVYGKWIFNPRIEYDESVSFEADGTTWYKAKYILTVAYYETVVTSFFGRDFYKSIKLQADNMLTERDGEAFFAPNRIGGCGGYGGLVPNRISVISKSADKIVVLANMQGVIGLGYDDLWEDGDLVYTFLSEGGNWVLQNFYGTEP